MGTRFLSSTGRSEIGRVAWSFGPQEEEIAQKLADAVEVVTGVRPTVQRGRLIRVYLYSLQWSRLFQTFGKRTGKHLPTRFRCGNPVYLKGLYDGLVDSDGYYAADGRVCFKNTSRELVELFGVLCLLLWGSFPNVHREAPNAGGLAGTTDDRCNESFVARLQPASHQRHLEEYVVVKQLEQHELDVALPSYDIEVDCETHSFIANNAIVHNSICDARCRGCRCPASDRDL